MAREYAFLMIDYDTPEIIKDIHNKISDEEVYTEKDKEYGIEHETHVTVVPCLDNDVNLDKIKKMLEPLEKYKLMLNNISMFTNNEKFDVLKCDANSFILKDTNKKITSKFPTHSEYKEYNPHVTIAYLKKDIGEKYTKDILSPLVVLKPKRFHFSYVDKNGDEKDIYFK
jgi:2'-5' RNA ligase